jgi:YesN/AraC family two-component response regulator
MACESCKVFVAEELKNLRVQTIKVDLGEAEIKGELSEKKVKKFVEAIKKAGLELVQDKDAVLCDKIKAEISAYINDKASKTANLSAYLAKKLKYDYAYLSAYFSAMQASTIEQYTIALKIEKVKEMLVLDGDTLKDIAVKLNYSSVSHLSNQFKKVAGLSASHFKKLRSIRRKTMQDL